jgi:hypothetical protein
MTTARVALPPLLAALGLVALGCRPAPPEAPETLDELCAFVFSHHPDEDATELIAGVEQLADWLDANPEDALEGYSVQAPGEDAIDALDGEDRTAEGMIGLAVSRQSRHPLDETAWALIGVDQDEIYPETYDAYAREYVSGPDCFLAHECDAMEAYEEMSSSFALGMTSESRSHNQYRWIETGRGTALVHRNWLREPPTVNNVLLEVHEQAYVDVLVPGDDGVWRLQSQFTVYTQDDETYEQLAVNLAIDFLIDLHDIMEDWLDDNEAP